MLPNLISSDQNPYVANRFMNEGGRLKPNILEMIDILKMEGYLFTTDIEKAFGSTKDCFLLAFLAKYDFKKNSVRRLKLFLDNQESCIIIGELQLIISN